MRRPLAPRLAQSPSAAPRRLLRCVKFFTGRQQHRELLEPTKCLSCLCCCIGCIDTTADAFTAMAGADGSWWKYHNITM